MTANHLSVCALILLACVPAAPLSSQSADLAKLLDRNAAALVTVQLVLQVKVSGPMGQLMGDAQEFDSESVCTIIDPKGLILCSNTQLNGYMGIMQRVMGRMGTQSDFTATPTQIKVLIADEIKPWIAKLLVRDTDLDLAWLQIENAGGRSFSYIDFTQSVVPRVGDSIFAIRRLDKFFDRVPALLESRVSSVTQKPRTLLIPTESFEANLGIPVMSASGQAVGLLVLQLPDERQASGRTGLSLEMMNWSSRMQDVSHGVILPAQDVMKATRRALASLEGTAKSN